MHAQAGRDCTVNKDPVSPGPGSVDGTVGVARQNRPTHTWAEGGRGAHSGPVGHDVLMSTSTASQLATARSGSTSNALTLVPCSARQPTMRNTEGRSRAQFASANLDGSAGSSEAAASELHKAAVGRRDGRLAQGAPRRMQSSLATRMLDAAQRAGAIAPGPAAMRSRGRRRRPIQPLAMVMSQPLTQRASPASRVLSALPSPARGRGVRCESHARSY